VDARDISLASGLYEAIKLQTAPDKWYLTLTPSPVSLNFALDKALHERWKVEKQLQA
jgi:hypothetical protein